MGPFAPLSERARAESLREALAGLAPGRAIRVFAYGSLIWRPCFDAVSTESGTLAGYRRRFGIWTVQARGTPECPGLGLGLEPATGCCQGVVLEIPPRRRDDALRALWEREMLTGVYQPARVDVTTAAGLVETIAFVVDPSHPQSAGPMSLDRQAAIIARASGVLGSCRDYLANTVRALGCHGLRDDGLSDLLRRVDSG